MKVSKEKALQLAMKFKINLNVIPFDEWKFGLEDELKEHGYRTNKKVLTNITNNNLNTIAKIVIAHLQYDPMMYYYLQKLDKQRDKYWKNKKKPNIFL